jgi:hypothetical protein
MYHLPTKIRTVHFQTGDNMDNKFDKAGTTRRDLFRALINRGVAEVKEGYKEGLAEQTAKTPARKQNTPG